MESDKSSLNKFKIGDRVKITNCKVCEGTRKQPCIMIGINAVIKDIASITADIFPFTVEFSDNDKYVYGSVSFSSEELRLLTPSEIWNQEYIEKYSGYCKACGGWGVTTYTQGHPFGATTAYETLCDPCDQCDGKCPRCGEKLEVVSEDKTYRQMELAQECKACGWDAVKSEGLQDTTDWGPDIENLED